MRKNASLDLRTIGCLVAGVLAFPCQIANAWSGYDEFKPKTAEEAERRQRIEQEEVSTPGAPVPYYSNGQRGGGCSRYPGGCSGTPQFSPPPMYPPTSTSAPSPGYPTPSPGYPTPSPGYSKPPPVPLYQHQHPYNPYQPTPAGGGASVR